MLTRGDKVLIAFIMIIAISGFVGINLYGLTSGRVYGVVEVNSVFAQKISLGEDGPILRFNVEGFLGDTLLEVQNNKIRILDSSCPDKDCVRQGWISRPGQVLVCLPNRVVVKIQSDDTEDELDGISF